MSNTTPVTPREIVHVLVKEIDTLTGSFAELDGTVTDLRIIHEIACLRAAIIIIHDFSRRRLRASQSSIPQSELRNPQ